MKILFFVFTFLTFAILPIDARKPQKISNPSYVYRTHPTHTVLSVELGDTVTILEIEAQLYHSWWIQIGEDAKLVDPAGGNSYVVRSAEGITFNQKLYLPESGKITYRLAFPSLKKDVAVVDFFPFGTEGSCRTYGLRLDGASAAQTGSAIVDKLQGNWFSSDGSGAWVIGFKGDMVVWKSDLWQVMLPDKSGRMVLINMEDNTLRDTIMVRMAKDGSCMVGKVGVKGVKTVREQKFSPDAPRTADDDRSWSELEMLASGKALVRGVINGYNPTLGWTKGQITVSNAIEQEDYQFLVDVLPDGTFRTELDLPFPSEVMIALNDRYFSFTIAPSDTIVMWIEYDELSRSKNRYYQSGLDTRYMGGHARMNMEINRHYKFFPSLTFQDQYRTMGYRQFEEWYTNHLADSRIKRREYTTRENPSRKAVDYIQLSNILEQAHSKFIYPSQRGYYLEQDSTLVDRDMNIPISFFRQSDNLLINEPKLPTIRESYYYINAIEFFQIVRNASNMIELETIERLSGQTFPKEIYAVSDSLKQGLIEINKDNFGYYFLFLSLFQNGTPECQPMANYIKLQQVGRTLSDSLGIAKGSFVGDMLKASIVKNMIDSLENSKQIALLVSEFTHPAAIRWVLEANERKRPVVTHVETVADTVQHIGKESKEEVLDAEEILSRVLAPYKGKVIYLDFWAMWCGPCRSGIEASYRVKDLVRENKDIVFAYITTEKDSPKAAREKFLADNSVTGEFLLISRDEWAVLGSYFNISGIPHYVIIGKDGKVVENKCRLHGSQLADRLKEIAEN